MTFQSFWAGLPAPVRTIINVAAGAALATVVTYLVSIASGGKFDAGILATLVMTAVGTAVVKSINPADPAYGIGSPPPVVGHASEMFDPAA